MIQALCGLNRVISNVNIPNDGKQIPDLPESAVVETNAVFEYNKIRPVFAGALTPEIHELMNPHIQNQELVLQAALNGDKELLLQAFLQDPLLKGRAGKEEIRALMEDMLKATV